MTGNGIDNHAGHAGVTADPPHRLHAAGRAVTASTTGPQSCPLTQASTSFVLVALCSRRFRQ